MTTIEFGTTLYPSRFTTMRNYNPSKATELRWKAAQWRRYAAETNQFKYMELMDGAANDLEREADKLERHARLSEQGIRLLAS